MSSHLNANPVGPGMLTEKSIPYADELKCRVELTKAFCDTAKSYVQISTAALALPLVFTQTILGRTATEQGLLSLGVPWTLTTSWIAFLCTVVLGLVYQWLAIRRVWNELHTVSWKESRETEPGIRNTKWIPTLESINRSYVYGGMLLSFFVGALFFVVFAASRLGW